MASGTSGSNVPGLPDRVPEASPAVPSSVRATEAQRREAGRGADDQSDTLPATCPLGRHRRGRAGQRLECFVEESRATQGYVSDGSSPTTGRKWTLQERDMRLREKQSDARLSPQ